MKISKNNIGRREYAYLSVLMLIAFSYLYAFSHIDVRHLTDITNVKYVDSKIVFFIFFSFCFLLYEFHLISSRLNDAKISKWSLIALLVPYICALYHVALFFAPSKESELHKNCLALKVFCLLLSIYIMVISLYLFTTQFSAKFGSCVFLTLFVLLLVFIVDIVLKLVAKLIKTIKTRKE